MQQGQIWYFIDKMFLDYNDPCAMGNKSPDEITGMPKDRPYCIAYTDSKKNLCWAVPLSSQINKYSLILTQNPSAKIKIYNLMGQKSAFLIQNILPVSYIYIKNQKLQHGNPVSISNKDAKDLSKYSRQIVSLVRYSRTTVYTDIMRIESFLLS